MLAIRAISKFLIGLIIVGLLLFLPAGGFDYFYGWLFIALLFIPIFILGLILFIKAPNLLEKRLNAKEKQNAQKGVVGISALIFTCGFVVAGLDYRFGWSSVPLWVTIVASVVLILSYALYAEVMRENAYLSRTIEVQENQKVIDKGLYGIIRHPLYAVSIWLFLAIPIVLASWWAVICFAPYLVLIVVRILNEERLLLEQLDGYAEYAKRVKYRLIPFIW